MTRAGPAAVVVRACVLAAAIAAGTACERRARPAPAPAPRTAPREQAAPAPVPAPAALATFRDVAAEAGIDSVNHSGKPDDKDWIVSAMGGGAIALDHDSDGDMDLVVVDGTMLTDEGDLRYDDAWRTRLWRNDGGMRFTDVTAASGIDLKAFGIGGASCDYDADGHPDFYVCCWGASHLFRNRGDGTFEDVTAKAGVAGGARDLSTACAWGDLDGDGAHDLYVATHVDEYAYIDEVRATGIPARRKDSTGREFAFGPMGMKPQMDRLYLGNGDGTFRDATATHLAEQVPRHGFQPVMTDVDGDGDLDVFVANDLAPNHLWINDGRGVMHDRAYGAGVAAGRSTVDQAGMGTDAEDYDRDGEIDLTITAFALDQDTIFLNRTNRFPGRCALAFTDASADLGLVAPTFDRTSWGVRLLDYDNDGWIDRFVANGGLFGERVGAAEGVTSDREECQLLRNEGPPAWRLTDVTGASGPAFGISRIWRGASFADFDDDGDTDVFATALNDRAALFCNSCEDGKGGDANGFVRFRLVGRKGQRDPSGARVSLRMPGGRVHVAELHHGASFCSDNDPRLLFGLGAVEVVPQVDVRWPGGATQTFRDVRGRSAYVIREGADGLLPDHLAAR